MENNILFQSMFNYIDSKKHNLTYNVSFTCEELDYIANLIRKDYQNKYKSKIDTSSFEFKVCNKLMSSYIDNMLKELSKYETQ